MKLHSVSRALYGTRMGEELADDGEICQSGRNGGGEVRDREGKVLRDWGSGHSEEGRSDSLHEEDGDGGDVRTVLGDEPFWGFVAAEEMENEVSEVLIRRKGREGSQERDGKTRVGGGQRERSGRED